jgi:hypothetical protein
LSAKSCYPTPRLSKRRGFGAWPTASMRTGCPPTGRGDQGGRDAGFARSWKRETLVPENRLRSDVRHELRKH